jgi:MarR family transcriptional regulator for hemolysin
LVGILDRMQRDGWIDRRPSETDRRRRLIRLAAAAEPVWEQVVDCLRQMRTTATRDMSEEEIHTLVKLLRRVQHNLGVDPPELPERIATAMETRT